MAAPSITTIRAVDAFINALEVEGLNDDGWDFLHLYAVGERGHAVINVADAFGAKASELGGTMTFTPDRGFNGPADVAQSASPHLAIFDPSTPGSKIGQNSAFFGAACLTESAPVTGTGGYICGMDSFSLNPRVSDGNLLMRCAATNTHTLAVSSSIGLFSGLRLSSAGFSINALHPTGDLIVSPQTRTSAAIGSYTWRVGGCDFSGTNQWTSRVVAMAWARQGIQPQQMQSFMYAGRRYLQTVGAL